MPERILFVPNWAMSPKSAEQIPGVRQLLDDLRGFAPVDVFRLPWVKGYDADCSWEGQIAALATATTDEHHLVVMGTCVAAALLAASTPKRPRSFIAAGMVTPPATLNASASRCSPMSSSVPGKAGRVTSTRAS